MKEITILHYPPYKRYIFHSLLFSEVIYQNPTTKTIHLAGFFITKARVFCIFVVITGKGHKLESF